MMMKKTSLSFILLISVIIVACTSSEQRMANEKQERIMKLISIGMNIDDARDILIKEGFKVGKKYFPTEKKNYYQMNVPLISKMPKSETIRYTTGLGPGKTKAYVMIIANPDGTITEIE